MGRRWRGAGVLTVLAALVLPAPFVGASSKPSGRVVVLTDANFDSRTQEGIWMVDIFAPWCSHCRQLEPVWEQFASEAASAGIHVAKVDGTKNPVLMRRFGVTAFPSIYLLRSGQAYTYDGSRSISSMQHFALSDYKSATAMAFWKAPNSPIGRSLGIVYTLPSRAKQLHQYFKHERGFSDLAIISGALLIPVAVGGVFLCVLDAVHQRAYAAQLQHEHHD